jgi:murein DD-endopeptidase MepM/ murein hydrolase activator NlpD
VNVYVGEKVSARQGIGTVIKDPADGTVQLHFEIYRDTKPVNPEAWLAR